MRCVHQRHLWAKIFFQFKQMMAIYFTKEREERERRTGRDSKIEIGDFPSPLPSPLSLTFSLGAKTNSQKFIRFH